METPKVTFFSKIRDLDTARQIIKLAAYDFYFLAALQGVVGYFVAAPLIIDAVIIAFLSLFLHKFKSRIAAILLLLMSCAILFSTFHNKFEGGGDVKTEGGRNVFLAIIVLVVAIRAVEAAFKYHRYKKIDLKNTKLS